MKLGVVDVGGGLRGIYAAGVLDRCMDDGVHFDLGIGVSAGSANLGAFFAEQRGRNYRFYTDYSFRKEYMSVRNFLRKRSLIDLEYAYGTLSAPDGEDPFAWRAFQDNPADCLIVATDARTGEAHYFGKPDMEEGRLDPCKASSALPFLCRPWVIDGVPYYDGALSDPVPVEKAFALGCDRVVLLLTKPKLTLRTSERDERIAARIRGEFPAAAEKLCRRARTYNACVERAMEQEKTGRVLIVAPDDTCGVDTLTRDRDALHRLYEKGYADGAAIAAFTAMA
ncbi:MAG: patatin family protein [Oscillospiraceae bacterium]|nr:patatin family protein [Oscillospiraceae bacterium]